MISELNKCRGMKNILGEDKEILEQLRPYEVPSEVSIKADMPQLTLRRMRERYINAGSAVHPGQRPLHGVPGWTEELGQRLTVARSTVVKVAGSSDIKPVMDKAGYDD